MDDDADAGRELERLRAELTEFVVEALSERMASGAQPELGAALADAIDRRVDRSVDTRMADTRWPDPDEFASQVIAAARREGGGELPRSSPARSGRDDAAGSGGMMRFVLGLLTGLGIALLGYFLYSALQRPTPVQANVQAPITSGIEPTSTGPVNVMVEGGNQAAPAPANQQAPAR